MIANAEGNQTTALVVLQEGLKFELSKAEKYQISYFFIPRIWSEQHKILKQETNFLMKTSRVDIRKPDLKPGVFILVLVIDQSVFQVINFITLIFF